MKSRSSCYIKRYCCNYKLSRSIYWAIGTVLIFKVSTVLRNTDESSNTHIQEFALVNLTDSQSVDIRKDNVNISHMDKSTYSNKMVATPRSDYATFDPLSAKMVIILAYQRVGSSFLGTLFDGLEEAFYSYEPLSSIDSILYGIGVGENRPTEYFFNMDRSKRHRDVIERNEIYNLLENIFTCNFDKVPTEYLVSNFWRRYSHVQLNNYKNCMVKQLKLDVENCRVKISSTCPETFATTDIKQVFFCRDQLLKTRRDASDEPAPLNSTPGLQPFTEYQSCMTKQRDQLSANSTGCLRMLDGSCNEKRIRVVKTVRLSMDDVQTLIDKYKNIRIIHLYRDPRAVLVSRINGGWWTFHRGNDVKEAFGVFARGKIMMQASRQPEINISKSIQLETNNQMSVGFEQEARMYCQQLQEDIIKRRDIESRHAGRTMEVVYEDIVADPQKIVADIFRFLNQTFTRGAIKWAERVLNGNSENIAKRWRNELSTGIIKSVDRSCKEVYKLVHTSMWDTNFA